MGIVKVNVATRVMKLYFMFAITTVVFAIISKWKEDHWSHHKFIIYLPSSKVLREPRHFTI